jgi:hypothetical protein
MKSVAISYQPSAGTRLRLPDALSRHAKRKHTAKGRGEAEPVIRFAVDLLGDPHVDELTEAQWKRLDEALPVECTGLGGEAEHYRVQLRSAPYRRWIEIGEATHMALLEKNRLQAFSKFVAFF